MTKDDLRKANIIERKLGELRKFREVVDLMINGKCPFSYLTAEHIHAGCNSKNKEYKLDIAAKATSITSLLDSVAGIDTSISNEMDYHFVNNLIGCVDNEIAHWEQVLLDM